MGEARRGFDPEFRAGAVRIVRETIKPIAQVAEDLGINAGTLANWVQMDRLARAQDTNGGEPAESEREELARLRRHWGVVQSMGRVGCALDNAAAESFNSNLKVEYVHRHRFTTRAEARLKIATWIADFYNTRRRHSAADGLPPIVYEQQIMTMRTATEAKSRKTIAA